MNLIIQGPEVPPRLLDEISRHACSSGVEQLAEHAYRLKDARFGATIPPLCEAARVDYAFVPESAKLSGFGLVVMDMDSTLITIECIDEIADMLGIKPEVAAVTEAAMRGEIDFSESLRRRVALLSGLDESALSRVYEERLKLSPGAEIMLSKLKSLGIKTLLVSGGFTFFTDRLKTRLDLDFTASNTLEIRDGKLTGKVLGTIIDAQGKADWLERIRLQLNLDRAQVIAIGDGANDLKMLAQAGTGIAYHAKPVVREKTQYAFNYCGLDALINLFQN
ncbi:MAG: phosphoserine phosphatase SerB [Burkholderiales bacterium]|nr:phosphoserine phosphatase SerB [Burkholderiales bacterium]